MAADVIAVSYLDWEERLVLWFLRQVCWRKGFLTSTTAVLGGNAEPDDLKSLARDSRVMNSKSERDIVDIVRMVG